MAFPTSFFFAFDFLEFEYDMRRCSFGSTYPAWCFLSFGGLFAGEILSLIVSSISSVPFSLSLLLVFPLHVCYTFVVVSQLWVILFSLSQAFLFAL